MYINAGSSGINTYSWFERRAKKYTATTFYSLDRVEHPAKGNIEASRTMDLTRELAKDFVCFKLGKASAVNVSPTARTLRRVATEVETSHGDLFQSMIRTITCESDDISRWYSDIMKSMFSDNVINWGRIAVLFTFSGQVAIHCEKHGSLGENADLVVSLLTDFVNSRLLKWIQNAGGWVSLLSYRYC